MRLFLGVLFAVTQAPRNGGIVHSFDVFSDGLFPATNLWKIGLKHWHFKELIFNLTYSTLDDGDNEDQAEPYWATDQMVQLFNDYYKNIFENGWKVTID